MTATLTPVRMSSAGYCPRRQAYAATGVTPTNEPDRQARNRMALGDAAEDILVRNLIDDGWEVAHTRAVDGEQLELEINQPLPMTGHPDGLCRHPEHTRNLWVTLECKSMSEDRVQRVRDEGIAQVYPEYLAQAICYSRVLYDRRLVAHPRRAVFAVMSREGHMPAPERVAWDQDQEDRHWRELRATWQTIQESRLPSRPYEPDDPHCRYCPYFNICQDREPADWRRPHVITEPWALAAARRWLHADRSRRESAALLREAAVEHPRGIIAGPVQASWFHPRSRKQYDPELLERRFPAEELRLCLSSPTEPPAFWIRPARRQGEAVNHDH